MNYHFKYIFLFILAGLFFHSCMKEELEISWAELSIPSDLDMESLVFINRDTGYVVGGDRWNYGELLYTKDGGANWIVDSFTNKKIFDIQYSSDGIATAVGIDGYFFSSNDFDRWKSLRLPYWSPLNSVFFQTRHKGVAVGGVSFGSGWIATFGENGNLIEWDTTFQHELSDVYFSDPETVHAVGYGIVLRSEDAGITWTTADIQGDFFRAVHFPTPEVGYAVGFSGTIIKTTDAGLSWQKIRNGNNILVSNLPFRDVFFLDEDTGYIVGHNGTFRKTINGGENWTKITMPSNAHLNKIFMVGTTGYIVAENGKIFKFEDD